MKRILFIEDDTDFGEATKFNLEHLGDFQIEWRTDGSDALDVARRWQPDLLLFDVMLPNEDGFEILERLRKNGVDTPAIFLTARTLAEDAIRGFGLGAADYVRKPFDIVELQLRIERVLTQSPIREDGGLVVEKQDIVFDFSKCVVSFLGAEVQLTPYEAQLLRFLLAHQGELLDYDAIAEGIGKKDLKIYRNSFYVTFSNLRSKLSFIPHLNFVTLRSRGFIMNIGRSQAS